MLEINKIKKVKRMNGLNNNIINKCLTEGYYESKNYVYGIIIDVENEKYNIYRIKKEYLYTPEIYNMDNYERIEV